jgi:hypothetical protein
LLSVVGCRAALAIYFCQRSLGVMYAKPGRAFNGYARKGADHEQFTCPARGSDCSKRFDDDHHNAVTSISGRRAIFEGHNVGG